MNINLDKTYFIIGAGNIGKALATRLCDLEIAGSRFIFFDSDEKRSQSAADQFGARTADSIPQGVGLADVIVIATPPLAVLPVLQLMSPALRPGQIVISMAAANPLARMRNLVPQGVALVRILPNPPIALGLGMDPVAYEADIAPEAKTFVEALLEALGQRVVVQDDQMNWCVGLSGASLRTLLPVLEGIAAAGVEAGLAPEEARKVAAQVMLGTAKLVLESDLPFQALKALTPMQTVDEVALSEQFREVVGKTKAKADDAMAKVLALSLA